MSFMDPFVSRAVATRPSTSLGTNGDLSKTRFILAIAAIWLGCCALLLWMCRTRIPILAMWDPDDYLRLQQVRDLIAGQNFFDVSQYRIDPPRGVPMHWSRIVDLPLAGLMLVLRPLLGTDLAERVTISVVPLISFGGTLSAIALLAGRLADHRTALIAAMLACATPLILFHILPMRIDHHGWQTMLGLFAIAACFDPRARRGGTIAGGLTALWLAISLEAMPMAAAMSALLALRFLFGSDQAAIRFRAFTAALVIAGAGLFAAFHGAAAWSQPVCDAASPAWAGPLVAAPLSAWLLIPFARDRGAITRLAILATAAATGVALFALTAPACLHGPFAALDPVVRHFWYDNVLEGLPAWRQPGDNALGVAVFPPIGLAGMILAWRSAATARAARNWLSMLGLALAAFILSLFVQRAGGLAHGCALPGAAYLLARILNAVARWRRSSLRIVATTMAIIALAPVGAVMIGHMILDAVAPDTSEAQESLACKDCDLFGALRALPPAYVLAGLDITPRLLVNTPHRYAASGHHRGAPAIRRVIDAFTGEPEQARRIMATTGMSYVLIDPHGSEASVYGKAAPHGLMAALAAGRAPAWLRPVPLGSSPLRMWKRVG